MKNLKNPGTFEISIENLEISFKFSDIPLNNLDISLKNLEKFITIIDFFLTKKGQKYDFSPNTFREDTLVIFNLLNVGYQNVKYLNYCSAPYAG